jgi:hypothetical protein
MPVGMALGEGSSMLGRRAAAARCRPEVAIVAAMADLPSLREACDEEHPDVVLSDIRMPPTQIDEVRRGGGVRQSDAAARQRGDRAG